MENSNQVVRDMIVNLYVQDVWRKTNCFNTRRVFPSDKERVLNFVQKSFPNEHGWLLEIEHSVFENECFISVNESAEIIGFACFDCTGKGYFGPFGVEKSFRGNGVGTELFYACLDAMKAKGYGYAVIGWVDESAKIFYEKAARATYISCSEPEHTLYKRRILTANRTSYEITWDELSVYKKWGDAFVPMRKRRENEHE